MAPTDRDIWNREDWTTKRGEYAKYRRWYEGKPLEVKEKARDRQTNKALERYPLKLNTVKLACDIHRDISRGVPFLDDPLIIKVAIEGVETERSDYLEETINDLVWRASSGGAIQQEALLAMNQYGGTAFKLSWEPWDFDLPLGLAVRPIKDPSLILPTMEPQNPWRLLSCYYGYELDPKVAKAKYGINPQPEADRSLYMEYWDRSTYRIRVDGQVPTMRRGGNEYPLQGDNPWGFVPVYYIPHERTTKLFGDSQAKHQAGMAEEISSRTRDISDIVRNVRGDIVYGTDLAPKLKMEVVFLEGQPVMKVLRAGDTRGITNAQPPRLNALPMPDLSDTIATWPETLLDMWMMFSRISPAAFGRDDTRSGRITGPAVTQRMYTSVAHCTTERINFTTVKLIMDRDILRILRSKTIQNDAEKLSMKKVDVTDDEIRAKFKQLWPPMMPLDRQELHRDLIDEFREGAISPETLHERIGIRDTDREKDRIEEWGKRVAEVEALANPAPFPGGNKT